MTTRGGRTDPRGSARRGTAKRSAEQDATPPATTTPQRTKRAKRSARASAAASPPIVGIGASAGGLDAFLRLVQHLPSDAGFAYVFVQHLAPEHESVLPELLGRAAVIPVLEAGDGMRVEANHAYVIPPKTTMTVTDGHLRLAARPKSRAPHLSIDAFLCSLARVHGAGSVGVILSGAGSDGARGIEAIKEAGGITMAQDGATASHAGMPTNAIATGAVDFVLSPEKIAEQLAHLGRHLGRLGGAAHTGDVGDAIPASSPDHHDDDEELRKIFALLQSRTGVDFQHYRRGTVHRRILRRMLVHQVETRRDYVALLQRDPAELDLLYDDLLIGVTGFFRDPDVFETLQRTGLPAMMRDHAPGTPVRIWVVGCSGGEEAYSLAIATREYLDDVAPGVPIQLFGTDLSDGAIARARAGLYPKRIAAVVSPERLRRFFIEEESGYRIAKPIRDGCVFSRQNVVRDPPFSHLDLVSCRNVLIYLEPELQRRVLPIFHYALEPNGLLLLGSSESVGSASPYFTPLAKRDRIYRRLSAPSRPLDVDLVRPAPARTTAAGALAGHRPPARPPVRPSAVPPSLDDIQREADRAVLARFAPPGVVVDEQLEILHFRGTTSGILAHGPGAASLSLLKLARRELIAPLRDAIRRATADDAPVRATPVTLADGATTRRVAIEVLPFRPPSSSARFFTVIFHVLTELEASPDDARRHDEPPAAAAASAGEERQRQIVEEELAATKRYLQGIVEEHESAVEELRAASEEIQSSNEELQSINEELETTKEEVQSTNEELTTVNEELRHRNRELAALSNDLANVLASTTIPIVIVGRDLKLRRFTPAAEQVMKVIPSDVGRPLGDVKLRVALSDLEAQITQAIDTLAVTTREVRGDDGRWWELAVRPYQTVDRRVDGAVLVFTDIDASKRYSEQADEIAATRQQMLLLAEEARTVAEDARTVAESANAAKSGFLASMSHDLRTPLNAITGYTELLEMGLRGPVSDAQATDLARIKRSARHLLSLINDILNFAKLEAGHLEFRVGDVALAMLLAEMEELILPQIATKALRFERDDGPDAAAAVRADPEKLRQILLNLLSNAIKFTPPGGRIGARVVPDDVGLVRIETWDTGVGIASDQLDRIFDPFVQVGRGLTTPSPDGVGLGLAISRDLARAMNGELTVASVPGRGSTFTLTLPRAGAGAFADR